MTAATITTKVYASQHTPGQETVVLTASNDETYDAVTLKTVDAAQCTIMEDDPRAVSVSISGRTVTLRISGLSSKKVCLTCFGTY